MDTYLFLNIIDRKKLVALARSKQLSVSTASAIIINNYSYIITNWFSAEYINKGDIQLHIKVRTNGNKVNTLIATNSIYAYFHQKEIQLPKGISFTNINRRIQSEMDTTYDKNENKNVEIRASYRAKMEQQHK